MANEATVKVIADLVKEQIGQANQIAERVTATSVNPQKFAGDVLKGTVTVDDESVQKELAWREAALAEVNKREEALRERLLSMVPKPSGESNVEADKAAYAELKASITGGLTVLKTSLKVDPDSLDLPALKSLRGGSTGATGTGTPKPRVKLIVVDGQDIVAEVPVKKNGKETGETKTVSNFTLAARHISKASSASVSAGDLQAAFFEEAGTTDVSTIPGKEVSFYFEAGEGENRHNHEVRVFTKDAE